MLNIEKRAASTAFLDTLMKRTEKQVAPFVKNSPKAKAQTDKAFKKAIDGDAGSFAEGAKKLKNETQNMRTGALNGAIAGANWKILPNMGGVKPNTGFLMHRGLDAVGLHLGLLSNPAFQAVSNMAEAVPGGALGGAALGAAKGAVQDIKNKIKTYDAR